MPREPRAFAEGAVYHVYNPAAHGVAVLADETASELFNELVSRAIRRDGHPDLCPLRRPRGDAHEGTREGETDRNRNQITLLI